MKILDTTLIVDPSVQQPFTGPSLSFVQDAYKEAIAALARIAIVDTAKVTVLYGCVNSTPGGATFTISAGAVYYNGEIYLVPAATLVTAGNVVVINLVDTNTLGNQTFSDGIARTTSHNRTGVFALGLSGTTNLTGTTASNYTSFAVASRSSYFTPVVTASTGSYVTIGTGGRYTILGPVAHVSFAINISGGSAGNQEIYIAIPADILNMANGNKATGFTSPGGDISEFVRIDTVGAFIRITRIGVAAFGVLTVGTEFNGEITLLLTN